jgi:hypothetical protein
MCCTPIGSSSIIFLIDPAFPGGRARFLNASDGIGSREQRPLPQIAGGPVKLSVSLLSSAWRLEKREANPALFLSRVNPTAST